MALMLGCCGAICDWAGRYEMQEDTIRFLDEKGIGRPSTYNAIITTIVSRNYVTRDGKSLVPTTLGELTTRLMKENFPDIVDYAFTAQMETELDEIEKGEADMKEVLSRFWADFSVELDKAQTHLKAGSFEIPVEKTDLICEKCGAQMVVKEGRYGKFAACPNYPACRKSRCSSRCRRRKRLYPTAKSPSPSARHSAPA